MIPTTISAIDKQDRSLVRYAKALVNMLAMKLDLFTPNKWENLCEWLGQHLSLADGQRARAYRGLNHAVFEITYGLSSFFPHKRSIAIVTGNHNAMDFFTPHFYKSAYHVQMINHKDLTEDWLSNLKKDTLFVLFAEDHPVTAELFDYDQLDARLNDQKIISVGISHNAHFFRKRNLRPYSVRIESYDHEIGFAILGDKVKAPSVVAQSFDWDLEKMKNSILADEFGQAVEDKAAVVALENQFQGLFTNQQGEPQTDRLYDRALIFSKDHHGETFADALKMKLNESRPDWTGVDTTNLCRWGGSRLFPWWKPGLEADVIRGLIILSADVCRRKNIDQLVKEVFAEITF